MDMRDSLLTQYYEAAQAAHKKQRPAFSIGLGVGLATMPICLIAPLLALIFLFPNAASAGLFTGLILTVVFGPFIAAFLAGFLTNKLVEYTNDDIKSIKNLVMWEMTVADSALEEAKITINKRIKKLDAIADKFAALKTTDKLIEENARDIGTLLSDNQQKPKSVLFTQRGKVRKALKIAPDGKSYYIGKEKQK